MAAAFEGFWYWEGQVFSNDSEEEENDDDDDDDEEEVEEEETVEESDRDKAELLEQVGR